MAIFFDFIFTSKTRLHSPTINDRSPLFYGWSGLVSMACFYNLLATTIMVFQDFYLNYYTYWLAANLLSDMVNLADLLVQSRKEYLDNGVYVQVPQHVAKHYFHSQSFLLDCASLLPTDLVLLSHPQLSIVRANRLFKLYRALEFVHLAEIRTNFPHLFRIIRLTFVCLGVFHCNGCFYYWLSLVYNFEGADVNDWIFTYTKIPDLVYATCDTRYEAKVCLFDESERDWHNRNVYIDQMMNYWTDRTSSTHFSNLTKQYGLSFYWSALTLVTLGEQPWPNNSMEMTFEILDTLLGLLIFAIVIGDIGVMVTQKNLIKVKFEDFIDRCKHYMKFRKVHPFLVIKIMNWFEYFWKEGQAKVNEQEVFSYLPRSLRRELASQIHMETMREIPLFKDCEEEFLQEIISCLQFQIFNPGEYIFKRGDVAKTMYIIKRGKVELEEHNLDQSVSNLTKGSSFGEFSILKIPGNVNSNRRTQTARAQGFADLYVLDKRDLNRILQDFPLTKNSIFKKANTILHSANLLATPYSQSDEESFFDEEIGDSSNPVNVLRKVQRKVIKLTQCVDEFELKFLNSTQCLKQSMSRVEGEYYRQRKLGILRGRSCK